MDTEHAQYAAIKDHVLTSELSVRGSNRMSQQQRTGKIPVTSSREDTLSESQWSMEFDNYEEV